MFLLKPVVITYQHQGDTLPVPPALTFASYHLLSPFGQLYYVLREGVFLARRVEAHVGFSLYHCADGGAGWFVEVSYDEQVDALQVRRIGRTAKLVEDYAPYLQLPQG